VANHHIICPNSQVATAFSSDFVNQPHAQASPQHHPSMASPTTTAAPTIIAPSAPSDGTSLRTAAVLGGCVFVVFVAGLLFLLCRCPGPLRRGAVPATSALSVADGRQHPHGPTTSIDANRIGWSSRHRVVSFVHTASLDPVAAATLALPAGDAARRQVPLEGSVTDDGNDYGAFTAWHQQRQQLHSAGSDQPAALDDGRGDDGSIPTPRASAATSSSPLLPATAAPLASHLTYPCPMAPPQPQEERGAALL